MVTEIFNYKGWVIVTHDFTFNLDYKYYSQHRDCDNAQLIDWDKRKCYNCGTVIPDTIQGIMAFLVWKPK